MARTRQKVRQLRPGIEQGIKELAKKVGMEGQLDGSMRFSSDSISFRVQLTPQGVSPALKDFEAVIIDSSILTPKHLGTETVINGTKFRIAGGRPRATKNCIVVRRVEDDKEFVAPLRDVERGLSTA